MKRLFAILFSVFFIACASVCIASDFVIFSGAGLIKPMEEMRTNFEKKQNIVADVHYGNPSEIFAAFAAGQPCDLLILGDEKYTEDALKNGWVIGDTITELVLHVPVIAVPKGNPAGIKGFMDLKRAGVRVAIGDPEAPAIGLVAKEMLQKAGIWEQVTENIKVYAPTVNQLLTCVALKQVDAAIIWGDLVTWDEGKGKLDVVKIEKKYNIIMTIPTAVCTQAKNKTIANRFIEYLSSDDGMLIWEKWGFRP